MDGGLKNSNLMDFHKAYLNELTGLMDWDSPDMNPEVDSLNLCNRPTSYKSILGYTTSSRFFETIFKNKSVVAIILPVDLVDEFRKGCNQCNRMIAIIPSHQPENDFYDLHNKLYKETNFYRKATNNPVIGYNCNIHPSAVIENNVIIGNNVTIGPNSVIREGSVIDDDVTIGCLSVIGSEGFQAIKGYDKMVRHVGGTHISKGVYVGDNSTIGNALFEGNTEIGEYCKISNHVQISHNCKIGRRSIVTACCMLMGSAVLKENVWLAPNSIILNGVEVGASSFVGTLTYVNKDIEAQDRVVGIPCRSIKNNV